MFRGALLALVLSPCALAAEAPTYISNTSAVPIATPANDAVFFPGDGRGVFVGVEYRW